VIVRDSADGHPLLTIPGVRNLLELAYNPDGSRLAGTIYGGSVKLWDTTTGKEVLTLGGGNKRLATFFFAQEGKQIITTSHNGDVDTWDTETGKAVQSFAGAGEQLSAAALSPDGKLLAFARFNKSVSIVTLAANKAVSLPDVETRCSWLAFNPDGTLLAGAPYLAGVPQSAVAHVWDTKTRKVVRQVRGHLDSISAIGFTPDGRQLVTAGNDGTVKLWNPRESPAERLLPAPFPLVTSLAFTPDGAELSTTGLLSEEAVRYWDSATGKEVRQFKGNATAFSALAKLVAVARMIRPSDGGDGEVEYVIELWGVDGALVRTLRGHKQYIRALSFSPDGKRLASGGGNGAAQAGEIKVWNAATGTSAVEWADEDGAVAAVAFSPDGRTLATADQGQRVKDGMLFGFTHEVRLWDVEDRRELGRLGRVSGAGAGVAFSPDGKRLAASAGGSVGGVWDVDSRAPAFQLKGHVSTLTAIAWSGDGRRIVTGSDDASVRVWQAESGQELLRIDENASVTAVAFSPNGDYLAIASGSIAARGQNRLRLMRAKFADANGARP
jgi:WD40 repeat protein